MEASVRAAATIFSIRRRLSLLGTKAVFNMFVSSKMRNETCHAGKEQGIQSLKEIDEGLSFVL